MRTLRGEAKGSGGDIVTVLRTQAKQRQEAKKMATTATILVHPSSESIVIVKDKVGSAGATVAVGDHANSIMLFVSEQLVRDLASACIDWLNAKDMERDAVGHERAF